MELMEPHSLFHHPSVYVMAPAVCREFSFCNSLNFRRSLAHHSRCSLNFYQSEWWARPACRQAGMTNGEGGGLGMTDRGVLMFAIYQNELIIFLPQRKLFPDFRHEDVIPLSENDIFIS